MHYFKQSEHPYTKVFSAYCVFTSRCLVTDPNNILCSSAHILTGWRLINN
jgi:hypothetical protein